VFAEYPLRARGLQEISDWYAERTGLPSSGFESPNSVMGIDIFRLTSCGICIKKHLNPAALSGVFGDYF
jgi:hypothetical protein